MRLITLHCDYITFKPLKKALKSIDDLKDLSGKEVKDPLVVLTAVEQGDDATTLKQYVEAIQKTATDVKATNIVLYPYAHLSSQLASPSEAQQMLVDAEATLSKAGLKVSRAPFGYYKEFELKCKGHPLSELSKEFRTTKTQTTNQKAPIQRLEEKELDATKLLRLINNVKLDTSKLKENDHRILGQKLGLFMFNETAPGMPYWLPKGLTLYNQLVDFWRREHEKWGYQEIASPLINKKELYLISGHWEHYKENMFISHTNENETYCLKPMNCPNAMIVFKSQQRSYKDFPLRLSDTDRLHRYELSGVLNGLLRCRSFQQDDSHNFITEEMIGSEFAHIFEVCEKFYKVLGLEYSFNLSTRPAQFMGDKKVWDKAEKELKETLKKSGRKFSIKEGDGAFYGPKIDIHMKDSLGREWQMGTMQLDFQLPLRFGLTYTDKEGKERSPVVVHRVIYGSLERFIGILLESTNGNLPLWLAPVQVKVLSFTDKNNKAAEKIVSQLKEALPSLRVEADLRNETVQAKVRDAEVMKIPYTLVIGDKEEEKGTLAVRKHGAKKPEFGVKMQSFIKELESHLVKQA
jgi:threonyl-tRNA synthetase